VILATTYVYMRTDTNCPHLLSASIRYLLFAIRGCKCGRWPALGTVRLCPNEEEEEKERERERGGQNHPLIYLFFGYLGWPK
jgi:hypothetical protein